MQVLLIVAIVVIALSIIAQAVVLVGMYLMSRRVVDTVNSLVSETKKAMAPLETITSNLRAASEELSSIGRAAHNQVLLAEKEFNATRESLRAGVEDIKVRVVDGVEQARQTILLPLHEWSAIATAIGVGIRTLFRGKPEPAEEIKVEMTEVHEQEYPAA